MRATPFHLEPLQSPISTPELMEEYPLILTCGGRSYEFFHSENRQLQTSREFHPWPLLTINPKTAEKYGIINGEWVWVENDRGRFRQKAFISPTVNEQTVHAEHAWWFPEQEGAAPNYFGTFDCNINNLTRAFLTGEAGIGSNIKAMICKIYPYKEGDEMPHDVIARGGFNEIIPGKA
jgi:anaerobic selenocysteine-containing dehydrogenase